MKKLLKSISMILCLSMIFVLAGCSKGGDNATDIMILVPNADHGWTGAVLNYAKEKADEINKAGKHTAKVLSSTDAANQISQIEDIIANKSAGSVVILPMDNTLESTMKKLASSDIPFVMFDRIIDSVADTAVSSVKGDNEGIGYETVMRFSKNDLKVGDKIYAFIGDTSSVPEMRNDGFKKGLKELGWTDKDISENVTFSAATGWSRATGKQMFVDWINSLNAQQIGEYDYIFTHDDEIAMGILEALKGTEIEQSKKDAFLNGDVTLAASSGLNEIYSVIKGNHEKDYTKEVSKLKDLFSVTYDPAMIQIAIDDMVKHLDGEKVEKEHVVPVDVVDKTNVDNFKGFGDAVSK
ncbi:MAG: substrate-binding domain-containing protein [Clostridium sp.]|nr:substrate-binding domain-containing protein [Clostridium sp.]MDU7083072.1 substrate-binding domain-containing protein [Clostridium sp.]